MFLTGLSGHLKPRVRIQGWGDNRTRSLQEVALLARGLVDAEGLPIGKTMAREGHATNTERWYAESILNTIPVYGTRAGAASPERIDAPSLHLDAGAQRLGAEAGGEPVWRDLHVKREYFARYIDWLRSVW